MRVHQHEYGRGLMSLAEGRDATEVLDSVSQKMVNKINHYIIDCLNTIPTEYNAAESQQSYKEKYTDRFGPKPDHIKE